MNVVRDERGMISGLEDDDGLVREVIRDELGRLSGIRDLRPVSATIEKATATIEAVVRREVRAALAELSEQLAKATAPPPAKPPASMARYFALLDQARRKMGRPNGSALHLTISSATASASAGDVARAIELLEDV